MPSNHIYEITEDTNGFLWIGTDNGVSRFDGKRFVNYTTKDGLPSNDVIQVIKDADGTIWVNCYKQPPSYFDEKNNKFVSFENDAIIVKNSGSLLYHSANPKGGIYFSNIYGSMFFKNKKLVEISNIRFNFLFVNELQFHLKPELKVNKLFRKNYKLFDIKNNLIGQINITRSLPVLHFKVKGNLIFEFFKNEILYFEILQTKPFKYVEKKITFEGTLKWYCLYETELYILTNSGKIIVYDFKKNTIKFTISTNKEINYAYKDSNGTIWIATLNDGLLKFNTTTIQSISDIAINSNFLSIHISENNSLFAGNYNGEILEKNKKINFHKNQNYKNTIWIRATETFASKIITVSDFGYHINYGEINAVIYDKQQISLKTALKLNDSILILGSINGLFQLNVTTNKYKRIKSPKERILSMAKNTDATFYFTANSGIYKYDLSNKSYSLVFSNSNLKNDNIQNITLSKSKYLWCNTFKGNIFLIKNKKIQFSIINSDKLPINITKLQEIDKQLWIASKDGIYVLDISNLPKYSIKKISKSDGLTSNFINDFAYKNDSIYVATNNGISILSKKINNLNYDILPIIISAKINNINAPIQKLYHLDKEQKNIILELAGVDLTGHFNKFQYSINNENWYTIEGNILNLLLKSGENNIKIRAIDENNNISKKVLVIQFKVAIPFYKNLGFQILIPFLISGILFFFYNRRKFEKQKSAFTQQLELEKQRSKIIADLHDEIGSTLSSLQINSTVANKLMEKDIPSAQKVLQKVESQAKSLAEKIGDIIWSMKPGKDEFMTLSTRIKNYCNEVLGSTDINYSIDIDEKTDTLITDFGDRKNVLLITKEAINNALKYSKATKIKIFIQYENNVILLRISDNGIGFNTDEIVGNGIGNMKNRAKELNATFQITSNKSSGTIIQLQFKVIP